MAVFEIPDRVRRNLLPIAITLVLGIVAWFGIGPMLAGGSDDVPAAPPPPAPVVVAPVVEDEEPPPEPPPEPVVYPRILVAVENVAAGVMLSTEMVRWEEWREALPLRDAVVHDVVPLRAIVGTVATSPLEVGDWITWEGILVPGHPGFISAVLADGMSAVTVAADRATTDANIIYPGDYVDIILVVTGGGSGPAARTVLTGTRVLAVGSMVLALGRYGSVSVSDAGLIEPPPTPEGDTYTLELTPGDAERVALAAAAGSLTLAMRPDGSPGYARPAWRPPTRFAEVLPDPPPPEPPHSVRIIRGTAETTEVTDEDTDAEAETRA